MKKLINLTTRNIKVYFSDKSMFVTSLVTPLVLLVLYATFLGVVFEENFISAIPAGINVSNKIIKSLVSGEVLASLLSLSCITVAFTSNSLMVCDKVNGINKDLDISPLRNGTKSLAYFLASFISTNLVNIVALLLCLLYTYSQGWYYTISDVLLLLGDVALLSLFGCSLSSVVNFNLKSQGQLTAVNTIVSGGYGFISGAYMPISTFNETLQKVLKYLPSTYATSLVKNHALSASLNELSNNNVPKEVIDSIKELLDCSIEFNENLISTGQMYLIVGISIIVLIIIFLLQNKFKRKH